MMLSCNSIFCATVYSTFELTISTDDLSISDTKLEYNKFALNSELMSLKYLLIAFKATDVIFVFDMTRSL